MIFRARGTRLAVGKEISMGIYVKEDEDERTRD